MILKFINTEINGLVIIQPEPFEDKRGLFYRVFCEHEYEAIGFNKKVAQINQSFTKRKGSIRGMHFQYPPKAEIKIVKCIRGIIFDVAIDLRKNSSTFLRWHGETLSAKNMKLLFIPEGFAHGFQTLEENCEIIYLNSEFYDPEYESCIRYNDPMVKIKWPLEVSEISMRDQNCELLTEAFTGLIL